MWRPQQQDLIRLDIQASETFSASSCFVAEMAIMLISTIFTIKVATFVNIKEYLSAVCILVSNDNIIYLSSALILANHRFCVPSVRFRTRVRVKLSVEKKERVFSGHEELEIEASSI